MRRSIVAATAAIAVSAALFFAWRQSSMYSSQSVWASAERPAAQDSASARPRRSTPLPVGDFDRIRGDLEVRARAGDAEAAYRLGTIMARCREYRKIPGGVFTDAVAQVFAAFGKGLRIYGSTVEDDRVLDTMLYSKAELDRVCAGAEGLAATTREADAHAWLLQAAMQGHVRAKAEYGRHAFDEFQGTNELVENATEVAVRRERARAFLQQAFDAGEPEALAALAQAHGPVPYLGHDPEAGLAYWLAYRRTGAGSKLPAGMASLVEENFAKELRPMQADRARQRAPGIARDFFDGVAR